MAVIKRLDALDQRVLASLRVPLLTEWIHRHPVVALLILVVLAYSPMVLRAASEAAWFGTVSSISFLLGVVWLVVAAIAAVEDMNDRGLRGWIWGVLVLLTNALGLLVWIIVRKDVDAESDASSR